MRSGAGTTMRIRLPRAHDAITAVDEPGPAPRGAGQLVLLVEDEEEVRDLVGQLLDVLEYRVIACADAAEALEVLADAPVDLLLTDIAMPGMSGAELAALVARDWPRLPVLMMSAYSQEAPSELTARAAQHGFLAKPFGLTKLAGALEALLGASTAKAR